MFVTSCLEIQLSSVPNYTLLFSPARLVRNNEACLFLHGFPGGPVNDPEIEKNRDIADHVTGSLGLQTFVTHYEGLGRSPGKFSFVGSLTGTISAAREILAKYRLSQLHLVGHSWGGLVAINAFEQFTENRGKLVLLSPFNDFPSDAVLRGALETLTNVTPVNFESGSIAGALQELRLYKPSQYVP